MKRYDFEARTRYGRVQWTEVEWDGGGWVRHADHAAALAERDALLVRAAGALSKLTTGPTGYELHNRLLLSDAPATLAAIREHVAGGRGE